MQLKDISYYFDLANFATHKALFNNLEYIHDVFKILPEYVKNNIKPGIKGKVMDGAWVGEQVELGEGSVIQPGAWVMGPAIIGKNCEIRHGAFVGANVVTGDHVVIGHTTEVNNAIFFDHSRAPHFAFVGHSILGHKVNLGAGTKLSNFKITADEIVIDGVKTGLTKIGAILGDRSSLGCNTVTQPATYLGKDVFVYPGTVMRGFTPSETVVKLRQEQETAKYKM